MIRTSLATAIVASGLAVGVTTVAGPAPAAHASLYCLTNNHAVLRVNARTGIYDRPQNVGSAAHVIRYKSAGDEVRGVIFDDNRTLGAFLGDRAINGFGYMSTSKMTFLRCEPDY